MPDTKATSIIRETLPILIVLALGGTVAGLFLGAARRSLDIYPGLLVLVPAMKNLRGSISGSLASRLSTALHQGTVRASLLGNPELPSFAITSLVLSGTMSLIIGVTAFLFTLTLRIQSLGLASMIGISLAVGLMAGAVHLLVNVTVSMTSYKKGLDPDNIAIPSLAITGDIATTLCFMLVVRWLIG